MKKVITLFLILLLAVLITSCSGFAEVSTQTPTATALPPSPTPLPPSATPIPPSSTPIPPTATPTETPIPMVHISFVNDTGGTVCGIFFYPTGFSGKIPNLVDVDAGKILQPEDVLEIDLEPGEYNASAWDCAGNKFQNFSFFELQGTELTWELSQPLIVYTEALVTIVNNLSYDLCEFYVRPGDSTDWGENILAPDWGVFITVGSTYLHWVDVGGVYDFQLLYCDGTLAGELNDQEVPSNMVWTLKP